MNNIVRVLSEDVLLTHLMVNIIVFQDEKMRTWDLVCGKVLDTKLLIWESLFQQLFLNRTKVNVNSYCVW